MLVGDADGYDILQQQLEHYGVGDHVRVAGHIGDEAIADHLAAADACLCLRWPTAQESSASWLRCLAAARPTVLSDLAHLADIPDSIALRVDLLDEAATLAAAMRTLASDPTARERIGRAGYGHAGWRITQSRPWPRTTGDCCRSRRQRRCRRAPTFRRISSTTIQMSRPRFSGGSRSDADILL